jgi:hypothetical protein
VWDGTTSSNAAKIYVDGVLDVQGTASKVDVTYTLNGTVGAYAGTHSSNFIGDLAFIEVSSTVRTPDTDYRIEAIVETSIDGGSTWTAIENGNQIPGIIAKSTDLTGKTLLIREILMTTDLTKTPQVKDLAIYTMNLITITNKTFPILSWQIANVSDYKSCIIKINGTDRQTFVDLTTSMSYTIDLGVLNIGDNTVDIVFTKQDDSTITKSLLAKKGGLPPFTIDESKFTIEGSVSIVGTSDNESYVIMNRTNLIGTDISSSEAQIEGFSATKNSKVTLRLTAIKSDGTVTDKGINSIMGAIG